MEPNQPPLVADDADLLRLTTAGSVDDGKSTFIGRLLYEAHALCEDHLASVRGASRQDLGGEIDFSLFTDGLTAEREQGITIDVAYRYFSTPRRRFIIADTPGHEQYTRNMATGASTADLAIILVDACNGLLTQSKRHAFIASLLGIPHVIVAINKMDLRGYSQEVFDGIRSDYEDFAGKLNVKDLTFIPISALRGDNLTQPSTSMPWYVGETVLHKLENVHVASDRNLIDLRFPVQLVLRPNPSFRGYSGTVESGVLKVADEICVLPSGRTSRIRSIVTYEGEVPQAHSPQAVTVTLEDELDVSRGDQIVHPKNQPFVSRELDAIVIWMHEDPLRVSKNYQIKHTTRQVRGQVSELMYRIDPNTLSRQDATILGLNEIGRVSMRLYSPIVFDDYERNRRTGSFIIVDPMSNATVGAGMIIQRGRGSGTRGGFFDDPASLNITKTSGQVSSRERERLTGQRAATLWLTGLSGAGKSTLAYEVERRLIASGHLCYVLDGDNVRFGLNRDLNFDAAGRRENIRRIAEVARLFNDAGLIVLSAFISPFRADRDAARSIVGKGFVEVFVDTSLEECEARDPKGLYRKARTGEIPEFTGISSPYEAPESPEVKVPGGSESPAQCAERILKYIEEQGFLT